ncbi:MAG: DM13 domain-containing protein [Sandaracinaceae bacterium]
MKTMTTMLLAGALAALAAPTVAGAQEASGTFRADAHPTRGSVRLVEDGGRWFVELGASFRTDEGPDLKVVLHRDANPRSYARSRYVSLGLLRRVNGRQRYAIPARIDPSQFRSVVIWCEEFNVTFGHAVLER